MVSSSADPRPVALIPAYKPEPVIVQIAQELLASNQFQGVVAVDDGSGLPYRPIFDELIRHGVAVVSHHVNLGKGMALRTGINHIACQWSQACGIVTLDADGQHLAKDVKAVAAELQANPTALIMGCRKIPSEAPLRSRFGNGLTRQVMRLCTGIRVSDTQTGLRGLPLSIAPILLRLSPSGYDFETEMLVKLGEERIRIREVPIEAVYVDGNKTSHFRPLRDSIAIYFVFLRHAGNALATAALDFLVFALALFLGGTLVTALVSARIVAGLFNFYIGRRFVFKSRAPATRELLGYTALVAALTTVSYYAIAYLLRSTSMPALAAKLLVESAIFLASFAIQRVFIFRSESGEPTATDWDRYYENRTTRTSPTRKITQRILLALFQRLPAAVPKRIIEFGGGDSCFFGAVREQFPQTFYLVVDKSTEGIRRFLAGKERSNCDALQADLLANPSLPQADLVYSVGLIEHFTPEETARIIDAHFAATNPGGVVVITYPTPTWLYRVIRGLAEMIGVWRFHDERPLHFREVGPQMEKHGELLYRKINWFIGLTQEIVAVRKRH